MRVAIAIVAVTATATPAAPLVLRLANGAYTPLNSTAATQALWKAVQAPW